MVGIDVCEIVYMVLNMVWDVLYGVIGVVCVCVIGEDGGSKWGGRGQTRVGWEGSVSLARFVA